MGLNGPDIVEVAPGRILYQNPGPITPSTARSHIARFTGSLSSDENHA
jgi:hypothetical protein